MGKHSNIILIDTETMKIIDCIKRVSIDVNRYRQLLPGKTYQYPPSQDKVPLVDLTKEQLKDIMIKCEDTPSKCLLQALQGISPAVADTLVAHAEEKGYRHSDLFLGIHEEISSLLHQLEAGTVTPMVFTDEAGVPLDYHVLSLSAYEHSAEISCFDTLSAAMEYYFSNKASSNRVRQKGTDLEKAVKNNLNKLCLKKQRLSEDLLHAEDSENFRLFGELLTANIHLVSTGDSQVKVQNYYDGSELLIPLDKRLSPSKNAQQYYKKYGKAKTAVKEKALQLEEVATDIEYVESVMEYLLSAKTLEEIEAIRSELVDSGYLKRKKTVGKPVKSKLGPYSYETRDGFRVLAGRNNAGNDLLTFKTASTKDLWFHAKDLAGSHVILFTEGREASKEAILEAASIAALHSKGKNSENVPVDYTKVKFVKKPKGAKPGMVIFTDNKTIYVHPYDEREKV